MDDEQIKMMLILRYGTIDDAFNVWANHVNSELLEFGWTKEEIRFVEREEYYNCYD